MAILSGFSIPVAGLPWDHAYVTSSSGKAWECFGRDAGGSEICSAIGNSQFANCLSDPKYATRIIVPFVSIYAGITYMTTGVCHQAANRILRATGDPGIKVAAARGYRWSFFAYGEYGTEPVPWPQLVKCASIHSPASVTSPSGGGTTVTLTPMDDKAAELSRRIDEIYSHPPTGEETIAEEEFKALADVYLGQGYPPDRIRSVARLQHELRRCQKELTDRLEKGLISSADCLDQLKLLSSNIAFRCEEILGSEDFVRLFGVPAKDAQASLN